MQGGEFCMKYATTLDGEQVVLKDLNKFKEAVKSHNFDSFVLYGAFGKGEGLVLNGKPRNDYDLLLVGGDRELQRKIENVKTGCINEVLRISSADLRDVACTQQWYEIKYASQLLAGKPLELPDWQPYDIPFTDAVISLEKRSLSMLIGKWEMMKDKPDERKIIEQIDKGIIAVGDATLIKRGQFHPKYSVRALMLNQDAISPLYQIAVSTKILGFPELPMDNLWQLWNQARDLIREFAARNQVKLEIGEILFHYNDSLPKENLKKILEGLGQEKWM